MQSVSQIRKLFIDFFIKKGHTHVSSSSVVPCNDPTLLFTNAGMNQFKDVFLGLEKRDYKTAVTSQRCLRAGGKQNDLDNVGYTARHHTLFEMLGNFSFGEYFKEQAITQSWELLTSPDYFALPADKLYVTVYESDEEAFNIWNQKVGLAADRIIRIGDNKGGKYESDNFWKMGDVGPCGPCSEIFYDHGLEIPGGLPGTPEEDGDRYIEIWNLVFMQFNQLSDGTMEPLETPAVDTGMGLERLAAVLQHVNSNFEIDLFANIIKSIKQEINYKNDDDNKSLRVIADHLRAITFMIADGIEPSNEKRGYVLRRILRRAIRHGYLLGKKDPFLCNLITTVVKEMDSVAEYIKPKLDYIKQVVLEEEIQFSKTIELGMQLLNKELEKVCTDKVLDGKVAFKLYDTYGFPLDLSEDICREHGIKIDVVGFDQEMVIQRAKAKSSNKFVLDYNKILKIDLMTRFDGYTSTKTHSKIIGLYQDGNQVNVINNSSDEAIIIVENTPFYAESGGQVGDRGLIKVGGNIFVVNDTQKYGAAFVHHGKVIEGKFTQGQEVILEVDEEFRSKTILNHTATHLLRSALVEVLGSHVSQKGSMNSDKMLRFDYNHKQLMTRSEIQQVELIVNSYIRQNLPIIIKELPIEEAQKLGAEAVFGEKYGDVVRVVIVGDGNFSIEFCGGIHVQNTGEIGFFKINNDVAVASGIRRIEAFTGDEAVKFSAEQSNILNELTILTASSSSKVVDNFVQLSNKYKALEKQMRKLEQQIALSKVAEIANKAQVIGNTKLLIEKISIDKKSLKLIADDMRARLGSCIIVLANKDEDGYGLVAAVSKNLSGTIGADTIIKELNSKLNGKGGGNNEISVANTKDTTNLDAELNNIADFIKTSLVFVY